jgi:4-amino-4-deoxy-L-arabinose transferase-like glycosyltransferase
MRLSWDGGEELLGMNLRACLVAHTGVVDLRTWRGRLWFGLTVSFSASLVVFVIGPTYLRPLPMWAQLAIVVAGCGFIATVALYSRRRARRANSL